MCVQFVNYCFFLFFSVMSPFDEQFFFACKYADRRAVDAILKGRDVPKDWNLKKLLNGHGAHSAHLVARAGWLDIIKLLMANEPHLVSAVDYKKRTPLFYAAQEGHAAVVRFLFSQDKAQLSHRDIRQWTVLHAAALGGCLDVVAFLVERGADILAQDKQGYTPLHVAAAHGHEAIVVFLADQERSACKMLNTFGRTPLHEAAMAGSHAAVALLCTFSVCDFNAHDHAGWTPLHWAATQGALRCVQDLIHSGADVGSTDSSGRTPLHCAAQEDQYDVACELIQHGALIDAQNRLGQTPLMMFLEQPAPLLALCKLICARKFCRSQIPTLPLLTLLIRVSDHTIQDKSGSTVATYFAQSDYAGLYKQLMRKQATYEAQVFALTQNTSNEIPCDLRLLVHQFVFGE